MVCGSFITKGEIAMKPTPLDMKRTLYTHVLKADQFSQRKDGSTYENMAVFNDSEVIAAVRFLERKIIDHRSEKGWREAYLRSERNDLAEVTAAYAQGLSQALIFLKEAFPVAFPITVSSEGAK